MTHITNIDFYFSISIRFFLESSKLTLTITLVNIKPLGSTHFYSCELLWPHGVGIGKEALQPGAGLWRRLPQVPRSPTSVLNINYPEHPPTTLNIPTGFTIPKESEGSWFPGMRAFYDTPLPREEGLNSIPGTGGHEKTLPCQTPKTSTNTSPPHTYSFSCFNPPSTLGLSYVNLCLDKFSFSSSCLLHQRLWHTLSLYPLYTSHQSQAHRRWWVNICWAEFCLKVYLFPLGTWLIVTWSS